MRVSKRIIFSLISIIVALIVIFSVYIYVSVPIPSNSPNKIVQISFDDVYLCIKDLKDTLRYTSVFQQPFLKSLKELHDVYGAVFSLYVYEKADNFVITEVPDKFRNEFIEKIKNKIKNIHKEITNDKEEIEIEYFSDAKTRQNFVNELKSRRKLDIIKGFTTKGVHRDDFIIYINKKEVGIFGSQGQNRTAMLSLKLSELQVIYDDIGEYPILLLDDFMSELDEKRRESFLKNIKDIQVIITCTEKITLENLKYFSYNVIDGDIYEKN